MAQFEALDAVGLPRQRFQPLGKHRADPEHQRQRRQHEAEGDDEEIAPFGFDLRIKLIDRREYPEVQLRQARGFHRPERSDIGAPAAVAEKLLGVAAAAPGIHRLREPDGADGV